MIERNSTSASFDRQAYVSCFLDNCKQVVHKREMSKAELRRQAGLFPAAFPKLRRNQSVSMEVLLKIAETLDCNLGDNAFFGCYHLTSVSSSFLPICFDDCCTVPDHFPLHSSDHKKTASPDLGAGCAWLELNCVQTVST